MKLMKKLLFILALCLSVFASAQCPPLQLTQNAKWKFTFSQCFQDTLNMNYIEASRIAYFDANKNLTWITYAALLDSLNVPVATPSGNLHNIQYNAGGTFGASTNFNYNGSNGTFYIYDVNGDTLFSVNTNTREVRNFGRVFLPNKPDSSVFFSGAGGELQVDSVNFVWNDAANSLRLGPFVNGFPTTTRLNITGTTGTQSTFRIGCIGNAGSAVPTIEFLRARGTTTTPTVPTLSSVLGEINFGGYDGASYRTTSTSIKGFAGGTWTTAANPTYLSFSTGDDNAATFTSYITKKGTLSILGGQNDTTYTLDVHGSAAIVITPQSASTDDSLFVKSSNNQVMTWLPRKRIALKNDSNSFGELNIKGSNALSTSFGIYTQSSAGTRLFTVANNGVHNYGTQTIEVFPSLNGSSVNTSGRGLVFSTAVTSQDAPAFTFIGNNLNTAAGSQYGFGVAMAFSPSSGTRVFNQFSLTGVVNQTGGANGIVRGIYVAPTLTSAADYRAIETTDGKVILGGTGVNSYLRVHVLTTAQRDALTGLTGGEIIFNSSTSKHQGYDGATWNDLY